MDPSEETVERVQTALNGLAFEAFESNDSIASFEVQRDVLHDALARLRNDAGFDSVTFITAIDHYGASTGKGRFEVIWQLRASVESDRVRLRVRVSEDDATVPTSTDLWPGGLFMERECWDLFGIVFEGHPNLARLLMPDGYGHHPLRKDFPHQGIEPDRLYREWDRERRKNWSPEGSGSRA